MITDYFFTKGYSHTVCQDYALACSSPDAVYPNPFIVISDGCSSSPHSEIGAMLMCLYGPKYLRTKMDFKASFLSELKCLFGTQLISHPYMFDATFIGACYRPETKDIIVYTYGDGSIIIKKRDGSFYIYTISYEPNYPFYLSYNLDLGRYDLWLSSNANHDCRLMIINDDIIQNDLVNVLQFQRYMAIPVETVEFIAVASDGIESFTNGESCLKIESFVRDLFDYKTITPGFVQRRTKRFLSNLKKEGYDHYDDFSLAVMIP